MAATITSFSGDSTFDRGGQGLKVREFTITGANNGDTLVTGVRGVVDCWWEGTIATMTGYVELTDAATGTITFSTDQASVAGSILVRSRS